MSSHSFIFAIIAILFASSVLGHSQMRCAKYDLATGTCKAAIRSSGVSFMQEANNFGDGQGLCQAPMASPISDAYSNGAACPDWAPCPSAMGTYTQGEDFTIMWIARNHAVDDQTPGNVYLYMSPVQNATVGRDVSASVMESNLLCKGPYKNCNGQNGDMIQCYLGCKMPANAQVGTHTLWWKWVWENHAPNIYTTCADINVIASSSGSSSSSSSSSSASDKTSTSSSTSTSGKSSTSSSTTTTSTGRTSTSTSGKASSTSTSTSTGKASSTSTSGKAGSTSTSTSSSTSGKCTTGFMKCLTSETYSTCAHNLWGVSQSCSQGTGCKQSGDYIYCVRP